MNLNSEEKEVCLRIKELFELSGMNQVEFSASIGVTQAALSNVINCKSIPGSGFIMSILREYQNVNSRWLFLGELPKFSTPEQQLSETRPRISNNIIHRSTRSAIASGPGSQAGNQQIDESEVQMELKKCREKNMELQDLLNKKNDELSQLQREYIAHLKKNI